MQIAQGVADMIAGGQLVEGDELPSLRSVAKELRVNYHTVARAYEALESDGVVTRVRGKPFVVAKKGGKMEPISVLVDEINALADRAKGLGISKTELKKAVDAAMNRVRKEK